MKEVKTLRKTLNSLWIKAGSFALAGAAVDTGQVLAAEEKIDIGKASENLGILSALTVGGLVSGIIRVMIIVAAIAFFIWLVLGGIRWIISGGDKSRTEAARDQITAALIGLVIVFAAFAIAQLIKILFGVDLFDLRFEQIPITAE